MFELAAVPNQAARLRIRIPNRSIPTPHTDPARSRSVRVALQGPAVVHCSAWASSLRVAPLGADMDRIYPSTDKANILKPVSRTTRLLEVPLTLRVLWMNFLRGGNPSVEVAFGSNHSANVFCVLDNFHFAELIIVC